MYAASPNHCKSQHKPLASLAKSNETQQRIFITRKTMFSFFFPSRHNKSRETTQQPRNSSEHVVSPLLDEGEPNESRYYRSRAFQEALLQRDEEREALFANRTSDEDTGRRSRYHRSNSTLRPKTPISRSISRSTSEVEGVPRYMPDARALRELPPPAYETSETPYSAYTTYTTSSISLVTEEAEEPEQPTEKPTRPRVLTEGVGPLVSFAKNKKFE